MNDDDTLDVVAGGPQIVRFEWPDWTPHVIDPQPGGPMGGCSYVCAGDINGDSNLDLVAAAWLDESNWTLGMLLWYDFITGMKDTIDTDLGLSYGIALGDIVSGL